MRARFLIALLLLAPAALAQRFYPDDPLLTEPPPRQVGDLKNRKLSDYYDLFWHLLATPGAKHPPNGQLRAGATSTLGDPLAGAWWEPRHYWRRMSERELVRGPGDANAPAMDGPWTVVSAKTEGITPGFVVLDRHKRRYFVKFDPLSNPELATGADKISSTLFYALGYHVPENYLVHFDPAILALGPDVTIADNIGRKRPMSRRDVSEILMRVPRGHDGRYRATASLALPGRPIGPYRYHGTRSDDPNDTVPHEHRRDLRAMHVAAAWLDHDDSRSINTLDIVASEGPLRYVRHYQLDFGSTLGSGSDKPNSPRSGGEYLFGWRHAGLQLVTLGLAVPYWARAEFSPLLAVGRFESRVFDPERWVPEYPNPAFLNRLPDDEFWMAKQIMHISDDEIRAVVAAARYSDPRAANWIARCLMERRDKIGRAYFAKLIPLDRFELRGGELVWEDLAATYGLGSAGRIRLHWSRFDNQKLTRAPLAGESSPRLPRLEPDGYLVADLHSAARPGRRLSVYLRTRSTQAEIVGIEHGW
jgi:hypothetical protein